MKLPGYRKRSNGTSRAHPQGWLGGGGGGLKRGQGEGGGREQVWLQSCYSLGTIWAGGQSFKHEAILWADLHGTTLTHATRL